jgi:hypothetical protein
MTTRRTPVTGDQEEMSPEPFLAALQKALRPEVLAKAGDELGELIASVKAQGKKGRLTLTVELSPMKNVPDVVEVVGKVAVKPPEPPARAKAMWPTESGRLETNDPRQSELPGLSAVEAREERAQ